MAEGGTSENLTVLGYRRFGGITLIVTAIAYLLFSLGGGSQLEGIIAAFITLNVIVLILYILDKIWGKLNDRFPEEQPHLRIPESLLCGFPLIGGWLGAFLGIYVVGHKTSAEKAYFRRCFWLSLVGHILLLLVAAYVYDRFIGVP
jgi:uncharacterized membrane protein YsdA (DUF1294 family)